MTPISDQLQPVIGKLLSLGISGRIFSDCKDRKDKVIGSVELAHGFGDSWRKAALKVVPGMSYHIWRSYAITTMANGGVQEIDRMRITGHKTNSMYRRYRIVDEDELREAQQKMQAHLETQANRSKVMAIGGEK